MFAKDGALLYANDDTQKRIHLSTDGGESFMRITAVRDLIYGASN